MRTSRFRALVSLALLWNLALFAAYRQSFDHDAYVTVADRLISFSDVRQTIVEEINSGLCDAYLGTRPSIRGSDVLPPNPCQRLAFERTYGGTRYDLPFSIAAYDAYVRDDAIQSFRSLSLFYSVALFLAALIVLGLAKLVRNMG